MRRGVDVPFGPLISARFRDRPNRFLVIAEVQGRRVRVASRDPGRLQELLVPGAELRITPERAAGRRTRFTLVLVRAGRRWACLVPSLANRIFEAALARGGAAGLEDARVLAREVPHRGSRFDFLLAHGGRRLVTEVKSATLVIGGRALFPDAPTARGVRHVRGLIAERRRGGAALLVFLVQRGGARCLSPCAERDPEFARALADAVRAGVGVRAYACRVTTAGLALDRPIPVVL